MKRSFGKLFLALVLSVCFWVFMFSGIHPQFHDFSDVEKIVIKVRPSGETGWPNEVYRVDNQNHSEGNPYALTIYEKTLETREEIDELNDVLGITWDGFIPLHSYESGTTTCDIKIFRKDGRRSILWMSEKEWGSAGRPPERVWQYIRKIMS